MRCLFYILCVLFVSGTIIASENALAEEATRSENLDQRDPKRFIKQICYRIKAVASAQSVPEAFLARLIWKESRFDPNAISPKGAQGIAQFMPGTAQLVGLRDPFEPHQAIAASAFYLNSLKSEFGNWGLAAAGYNAGPGRVGAWLSGASGLPFETQDFVESITGHHAEEWAKADFKHSGFMLSKTESFMAACQKFPTRYSKYRLAAAQSSLAPPKAWGIHLAANFSRSIALNTYKRLQTKFPSVLKGQTPTVVRELNRSFGDRPRYAVQVGADTRKEGEKFCKRLKRAGGACMVLRN